MDDSHVLTNVSKLFNNEYLSDVEFVIQNENSSRKFPAHKLILSMGSDTFKKLLYDEGRKTITLENISPASVYEMLSYLYCEKMDLNNINDAVDALKLAKMYELADFEEKCQSYINKHDVNINNISKMYAAALIDAQTSEVAFTLQRCQKFVCNNASEVLTSALFASAPIEVIKDILNQDELNVESEIEVVQAAIWWACVQRRLRELPEDPSTLRDCLTPLLPYLRLAALTFEEFEQLSQDHDIFTKREILLFVRHITQPHSADPIPYPFCNIRHQRSVCVNRTEVKQPHMASSQPQQALPSKNRSVQLKLVNAPNKPLRNPQTPSPENKIDLLSSLKKETSHIINHSAPLYERLNNNNSYNLIKLVPAYSAKPQLKVSPQTLNFTSTRSRTFDFQLKKLPIQLENISFMMDSFIKCSVHVKVIIGCIDIKGFELQLMDQKDSNEVIEVMCNITDAQEKVKSYEYTEKLSNCTMHAIDKLTLAENEEGEIEVEVENVKLSRCGMLSSRTLELNGGLNSKVVLTFSSNQTPDESEGLFFLFSRLHYTVR